jgi:GTP-binding protein HflX
LTVSLVGYTNAGKSTLFNALTGAGTYAADQLFATLDTLSRRLTLAPGVDLVLSDTVGFVRDLPHGLVQAFRATLEETAEADLLLHVVDASSPEREAQIEQVERVLAEIGADAVPQWQVWNKIDQLELAPRVEQDACGTVSRLYVSARTGKGLPQLRDALLQLVKASGAESRWVGSDADAARGPDPDPGSDPEPARVSH